MTTIATITVIIGAVAGVLITAQVMIERTLHGKPIRRDVKGLTAGPAASPLFDTFFEAIPAMETFGLQICLINGTAKHVHRANAK